jgi:hypothetical protein
MTDEQRIERDLEGRGSGLIQAGISLNGLKETVIMVGAPVEF